MAREITDKKTSSPARHGTPCSPEELAESAKCWQDMEDCFSLLNKRGSRKDK